MTTHRQQAKGLVNVVGWTAALVGPGRDEGFSLIELILVVVLVGVLAVVVTPRVPVRAIEEDAFFTEVIAAVRYAQKLAMASGCEVRVSTVPTDIIIEQENSPCPSAAFNTVVLNPGTGAPWGASRPGSISLSTTVVTFDKLGRSTGGATNISVTGSGVRTIRVEGETGFVHEL